MTILRLCREFLRGRNHGHLAVRCGSRPAVFGPADIDARPRRGLSTDTLPAGARVVVCGGGIVGTSVAYHLTELGMRDVVLLEQGSLTCGTTWHSAGLVGCLKGGATETALATYGRKLYKELDKEGLGSGWKECGSIFMTRTADRLTAYKRQLSFARRFGVEGEVWSPDQLAARYPFVRTDDLKGAIWVPTDGAVDPTDVTMGLAKKAKRGGARVFEKTRVEGVLVKNDRVHAVETDRGRIECQYFVNCAGQWARSVGELSDPKVSVPLHPCEHYYIITRPMKEIDRMMPVMRDYDGYIYFREWSGGLLAGGFELKGKPVFADGIPDKFEFQLLPEDWEHFQVILEELLRRLPCLEHAEIRQLTNGPESFTPDGRFILGLAPQVRNYFVLAGMNSLGVTMGPGVGRHLAEWIVEGAASINLSAHDIRRFVDVQNDPEFLRHRISETIGLHSIVSSSAFEYTTGRKLRTSPLHRRQEASGARFIQTPTGVETPAWFSRTENASQEETYIRSRRTDGKTFGKPVWVDEVRDEYWVCRKEVGLIHMPVCMMEVQSADGAATEALQAVCCNDVDTSVGMVTESGMLNHRGGYETDCNVIRLAENRYFIVGPVNQQTQTHAWLRDHLPDDNAVQLRDVTTKYTALNVIGPKAETLLAELTDTSLRKADFPVMTYQELRLKDVPGVLAARFTQTQEDGWILIVTSEQAEQVYESLLTAGREHGIRQVGSLALRSIRTEQGLPDWGAELTPLTTPLEAGRDVAVKLHGGDFMGRDALLRQKREGLNKSLVQFVLENHDVDNATWVWGGEPIYQDGNLVGNVTSATYSFCLEQQVALAYVSNFQEGSDGASLAGRESRYEMDIAGVKYGVTPTSGRHPASAMKEM